MNHFQLFHQKYHSTLWFVYFKLCTLLIWVILFCFRAWCCALHNEPCTRMVSLSVCQRRVQQSKYSRVLAKICVAGIRNLGWLIGKLIYCKERAKKKPSFLKVVFTQYSLHKTLYMYNVISCASDILRIFQYLI